ncbi:tyrosine-type recombinase/integrase [Candidatus Tisiphia endosymbiont of Hybos culiciformis]|uniref:tyrosine-type recombinase/integrase n=1 Tax=Candidatus Tisiphia endosymbiont of Hybos culiciformis TaxID=3139331 RepID=UPI003CCA8E9E
MTPPSFYFTNESIEKIICPKSKTKQDVYIDSPDNDLILIATSEDIDEYNEDSGELEDSKAFYLRTMIPLGAFPDLSIEEVRIIVAELRACICKVLISFEKSDGTTELNFKELFDKYIKEHCMHHNKGWKEIIAKMDLYGEHFYKMQISTITSEDIQKTFNDVSNKGIYSANRFLVLLRAIFNKAIEWKLLVQNPTQSIKLHDEEVRGRCINTQEEMSRFLEAINAEPNKKMADFFLMLLFTGAMKGNVLSMRWQDINFENRTWYLVSPSKV